ncbi:Protein of unknown function [Gryllus bimaculatus]|nr:Protein of unknown function [Gryllus bimaculatus]
MEQTGRRSVVEAIGADEESKARRNSYAETGGKPKPPRDWSNSLIHSHYMSAPAVWDRKTSSVRKMIVDSHGPIATPPRRTIPLGDQTTEVYSRPTGRRPGRDKYGTEPTPAVHGAPKRVRRGTPEIGLLHGRRKTAKVSEQPAPLARAHRRQSREDRARGVRDLASTKDSRAASHAVRRRGNGSAAITRCETGAAGDAAHKLQAEQAHSRAGYLEPIHLGNTFSMHTIFHAHHYAPGDASTTFKKSTTSSHYLHRTQRRVLLIGRLPTSFTSPLEFAVGDSSSGRNLVMCYASLSQMDAAVPFAVRYVRQDSEAAQIPRRGGRGLARRGAARRGAEQRPARNRRRRAGREVDVESSGLECPGKGSKTLNQRPTSARLKEIWRRV